MGAARLRITSFPVIDNGSEGRVWTEPALKPRISTSFFDVDHPEALNESVEPVASSDGSVPRFTWWPHKGSIEWVQYEFAAPRTVSDASVYWFDDTGKGGCRAPRTWRLLYRDGETWKPVENASAYGVACDKLNSVSFKQITTTALRLEVKLVENFSGGMLEWKVKDAKMP